MIKGYYDVIKCKLNIPTIQSKLQMKEITPSTEEQYIIPDEGYDGLASAMVKAVTNEIDPNILPENIRLGKSILGISGNLEPDKPDQSKTVIPTTEEQTVRADEGYELASVKVKAINLQNKEVTITENGTTTIEPDEGYDGLSDVDVNVSGILDTSDATAVAKDLAKNKTAYVNGQKITGSVEVLDINNMYYSGKFYSVSKYDPYVSSGFLTVYAKSKKDLLIRDSTAFVGLEMYNPNLANAIHLTPEKLKKDEVILGVTGTYEGEGADLSEYFKDTISAGTSTQNGLLKIIKSIPSFINIDGVTMDYMFRECVGLEKIPLIDISDVTSAQYAFSGCNSLTEIALLDTSKLRTASHMFEGCSKITSIPAFNLSNVEFASYMFYRCINLINVPIFELKNNCSVGLMFGYCNSLSIESLNNILFSMGTYVTNITKKTLQYIGLSQEQAELCTEMSNWELCVNAGWTTGY